MKKIDIPDITNNISEFPGPTITITWYKFLESIRNRLNLQNTGWTASTGVANKGAYAVYAGQVVSNPPTQAQMQALDDAVKALSGRVKALEDTLRANGAIN